MADDERGEGLQRVLYHADAVGEPFACRLQGRGLGGGDVVAAHVDAHEGAGGTDEGYERGAVDGAALRPAGGGGRPDGLGVGLGADDAEGQREAPAEVLQGSAGYEAAVAAVDVLGRGDVVHLRQQGRGVDLLDAFAYACQAVAQSPHGDAGGQGADVEQRQLDDAAGAGAFDAAEEDDGSDEHGADGEGRRQRQAEEAAQHGRRGEELRGDADENARQEEDGAYRLGPRAVLLTHHLHEGGASAAAQGASIDQSKQQRSEGGTDGEPPS